MADGNSLRILPEEVIKTAERLMEINGNFQKKVGELQECEARLIAMWEGESKDLFHSKFQNEKAMLDNFYNGINEYATALNNIAVEHVNSENKAISAIQGI